MLLVKPGLAALAAGGVLALSSVLFAAPADAATGPNSSECINAKAVLANAQTAQAAAQAQYNAAVKARDAALDAYNAALSDSNPANDAPALAALNSAKDQLLSANLILDERVKAVTAAQNTVDTACATVVVTPPPVGTPSGGGVVTYQTCAAAAAAGVYNIPASDPRYRTYLDRDHDGIACESNGNDTPTTIPSGTYTVVNGVKCKHVGTTWVPVTPAPAPTVTYTTIQGVPCHYNGTAWVPVTPPPPAVTAPAPCNCTPPAPAPQTQVVYTPAAPAPQVVVEPQQPVYLPPAQAFITQQAPSIPMSNAGDGSTAGQN